jgi:hypothetical protein
LILMRSLAHRTLGLLLASARAGFRGLQAAHDLPNPFAFRFRGAALRFYSASVSL